MKTQLTLIKQQLVVHGEISRNWCLSRYISRLGAYILRLKKEGWQFETETRGGDYYYIALEIPASERFAKAIEKHLEKPLVSTQLVMKI